ncbi:MAG: FAD-dependent oxidoreductase [Chitinivibrionales bacterium]|nr:FAD-dependent oxidoreductase [Chitinivibrionales bacterium]
MPNAAKKPDSVVIIGAGPAGLTLGLKLAEQGVPVQILESDDCVGGLCKTIHFNNCYFDLGGHRFVTKDREVQLFLEELMGDDLLVRPRKSIIILNNKKLNYPITPLDIITKLGPSFTAKAFADFLLTSALQNFFPRPDSSFEQWVTNRFGTMLYNIYFGPYSEKLWGIKPCSISSHWASQRIPLLNLWDVVSRALWRKHDTPATYARQFYYPKKGIGQICDRMAARIVQQGGAIRLNTAVTGLHASGDEIVSLSCQDTGGARREFRGEYIINTMPLPYFIQMCKMGEDGPAAPFAGRCDYRSIRFLHLCLDVPFVTDNTWIYIPEPHIPFFRVQELRNWNPELVPAKTTALTLEIACTYNDHIWTMPDDKLWDLCRPGLQRQGLLPDCAVTGYRSSYARFAYPMYFLEYEENVAAMYAFIARFKNLRSIGRQGLFRYNNMDHSIKMGMLTAENLLNGYPFSKIMAVATEKKIYDWQDPGK